MPVKTIIGVMGPGETASARITEDAYRLGQLIAAEGWVTLSGGRQVGVMHAVSKGAHSHQGLVIGILPDADTSSASVYIDIPVVTGMGSARNNINVLTAHVIIACGMGAGTISEVALALKAGKAVLLMHFTSEAIQLFQRLDTAGGIHLAASAEEAIQTVKKIIYRSTSF